MSINIIYFLQTLKWSQVQDKNKILFVGVPNVKRAKR